MDVTDKDSIAAAQKEIQGKEGKIHILINKYVVLRCVVPLPPDHRRLAVQARSGPCRVS